MRNKILMILILAAFIGGILPSALSAQPERPDKMMRPGRALLKDALQLTPEQEARLEEFSKARQEGAKAFREKIRQMRQDLRKLMVDPKADEKKINNLIDEISRLRADRMKAQFKNRKEWEKIFTPEQLKKLQEYRQDFRLRQCLLMGPGGRMGLRSRMFFRHGGFHRGGWR
jgi:Spy/CpxP family protein refolding chaperone